MGSGVSHYKYVPHIFVSNYSWNLSQVLMFLQVCHYVLVYFP